MDKEFKDVEYEDFTNQEGEFLSRLFAKYLNEKFDFLTMRETGDVYIKNSSMYKPKGKSIIKEKTETILPYDITGGGRKKSDVIDSIKDSTYIDAENFHEDPRYINLENGVYDIEENEFIDEDRGFIFRHEIPVKYDAEADCPKIKEFLRDVVREEDLPVVQELIGFSLYRDYFIQKAFMLLGGGSNGKSTFLNLLEQFLGAKNVANPSIHDLLQTRFSKIDLYTKLANINGDLDPDSLRHTGTFKRLTGGDTIRGEKKGVQDCIYFKNYAKLIYAANELPNTKDDTDAFFRRWIILEFPYKFTPYENDGNKDIEKGLLDKLTTEEELSGLFNWAVKGLNRLLENKEFTKTPGTQDIKKRWLMKSDSLNAFVQFYTEPDNEIIISKDEFMKVYMRFCDEVQLPAKSKMKVGRELGELAPVRTVRRRIDGVKKNCWQGIRFKDLDFSFKDFSIEMFEDVSGDLKRNGGFINFEAESVVEDGRGLRDRVLDLVGDGEFDKSELFFELDGFSESEVVEVVDGLVDEGVLFEPRPGFLKKL